MFIDASAARLLPRATPVQPATGPGADRIPMVAEYVIERQDIAGNWHAVLDPAHHRRARSLGADPETSGRLCAVIRRLDQLRARTTGICAFVRGHPNDLSRYSAIRLRAAWLPLHLDGAAVMADLELSDRLARIWRRHPALLRTPLGRKDLTTQLGKREVEWPDLPVIFGQIPKLRVIAGD